MVLVAAPCGDSHDGKVKGRTIDGDDRTADMPGTMTAPHRFFLLVLVLAASPARAQNEPFRVVNRTTLPAAELYAVPSGRGAWGGNLLNRGPLAPGAFFSLRPGEGAGCRFDLRLVLQDGRDITRREADICAGRVVEIALPPAATQPAPGGGGQDPADAPVPPR